MLSGISTTPHSFISKANFQRIHSALFSRTLEDMLKPVFTPGVHLQLDFASLSASFQITSLLANPANASTVCL